MMGKKIPERAIKWGSALIFIAFGAVGLYENLPESLLTLPVMAAGVLAILLLVALVGLPLTVKSDGTPEGLVTLLLGYTLGLGDAQANINAVKQ